MQRHQYRRQEDLIIGNLLGKQKVIREILRRLSDLQDLAVWYVSIHYYR